MELKEGDLELVFKGVSRCDTCELTRKGISCPRKVVGGFCAVELEKLGKVQSFSDLQEVIVFSLGELLLVLATRTKLRNALGAATPKELSSICNLLAKFITGTGTKKLSFEKTEAFSKLLTGENSE